MRSVASTEAWRPTCSDFGRSPKPGDGRYDVDAHLASLIPLIELGSVVVAVQSSRRPVIVLTERSGAEVAENVLTSVGHEPVFLIGPEGR